MSAEVAPVLHTKWGTARSYGDYYRITSYSEGNRDKRLHRLIWEAYHGEIPDGYVVHHKDGNKLNNDISNLELLTDSAHKKLFKHDEKTKQFLLDNLRKYPHGMLGKKCSETTKQKISQANKGNFHSFETKRNESISKNTSGYLFVYKNKRKDCKQGFMWVYRFTHKGIKHEFSSVDIKKLEQKVKSHGLPWEKLNGGN